MAKNSIPAVVPPTGPLLLTYLAAAYRVLLAEGLVPLTIGQPAPTALAQALPARDWTLVTAWNPQSVPCDDATNALADSAMVAELEALAARRLRASASDAQGQWHEDGWLVADLGADAADDLARRYGQAGILHWRQDQPVRLRMYRVPADGDHAQRWVDWVQAPSS